MTPSPSIFAQQNMSQINSMHCMLCKHVSAKTHLFTWHADKSIISQIVLSVLHHLSHWNNKMSTTEVYDKLVQKYKCVKLINSLGFKLPCMSGRPLLIWGQAWCGFSSSLFCYILCSFFPSRLPPFLFLAFADWRSVNREVPIRIGTTKVGNNVSLSEDSLTIPKILWMA